MNSKYILLSTHWLPDNQIPYSLPGELQFTSYFIEETTEVQKGVLSVYNLKIIELINNGALVEPNLCVSSFVPLI